MTLPKGILGGLLLLVVLAALLLFAPQRLTDIAAGFFAAPGQFSEMSEPSLQTASPRVFQYTAPQGFTHHATQYQGRTRIWYALGPKAGTDAPAERPPAIVLLHGSNRDGRSMLDMWQDLARQQDVTLIAPDALATEGWAWDEDGENLLNQVLTEAGAIYSFNPARVYLFGHSAGAVHALRIVNRTSGPWRAAAVHGGSLTGSQVKTKAGGVPLRLYLGEKDHLFPLDKVRAGARALSEAGHDTELIVIPGHTHWYYAIGPRLARHAWDFFSQH